MDTVFILIILLTSLQLEIMPKTCSWYFQTIYLCDGINHQINVNNWDVTHVTHARTESEKWGTILSISTLLSCRPDFDYLQYLITAINRVLCKAPLCSCLCPDQEMFAINSRLSNHRFWNQMRENHNLQLCVTKVDFLSSTKEPMHMHHKDSHT